MKKVLIVKPDHIGDYVLFRNFLRYFKESEEHIEITFLGNSRVRELAEYLDKDIVDHFIWIDLEKFTRSTMYRKFRTMEILESSYDLLINFMFVRFEKLEELIGTIIAEEKLLVCGTPNERKPSYKDADEGLYTQIVDLSTSRLFEYERFRYGFEAILDRKIALQPSLQLVKKKRIVFEDKEYILVFLGSDSSYRKWSKENYTTVINFIISNYDVGVVLCGGENERAEGEYIVEVLTSKNVYNLTGETSLVDMLHLVEQSALVISNETGVAHIATLMQKMTLVLSNANNYGKFTPYPQEYALKNYAIYPFEQEDEGSLKEKFYEVSRLDINTIKPKKVIKRVETILDSLEKIRKEKKKSCEQRVIEQALLDEKQTQINYEFSYMFSSLYLNILELMQSNSRVVLYGYGSFAKALEAIMKDSVIGIVDKGVHAKDIKAPLMSFDALQTCRYDKIVITVLGREDEIENYLVNSLGVASEKIVRFKILEGRYIGC